MARKNKGKSDTPEGGQPSQALQVVKKTDAIARLPDRRRLNQRMNTFLRAYTEACGNISAACEMAGISRRSYYRWINGDLPIYRRFQKRIFRIKPKDLLHDAAHGVVLHHLRARNLTAAMFTLNTLKEQPADDDQIEAVANSFQMFQEDHPGLPLSVQREFLLKFARRGKVPEKQLARKVGLTLED